MNILIESTSDTLNGLRARLAKEEHTAGESLIFTSGKRTRLTDLFALGRLLACMAHLAREQLGAVILRINSKRHAARLRELGVPQFCKEHGISFEGPKGLEVDVSIDAAEEVADLGTWSHPVRSKTYWFCLLPIRIIEIKESRSEHELSEQIGELQSSIAESIRESFERHKLEPKLFTCELNLLIYSVLRELIANAIAHSGSEKLIVALTLSRDTQPQGRSHRPGVVLSSGLDRFDLLVQDSGKGIARTVMQTLHGEDPVERHHEYFDFVKVLQPGHVFKRGEEALVKNLFGPDLVVRRGRKSEGLHDLGRLLSWFDGTLHLRTGRTEIQVSPGPRNHVLTQTSPGRQHSVFLPGVTVSALLPSPAVKHFQLREMARELQEPQRQAPTLLATLGASDKIVRCRFEVVPASLFGATVDSHGRRRAELDAELLATQWGQLIAANAGRAIVCELSLNLSENIDVEYLDRLVQELAKHDAAARGLLASLVLTGVPRNVVNVLFAGNCHSFLLLRSYFLLIIDETGTPHFLGVPSSSGNAFGPADALALTLYAGRVSEQDLHAHLGLSAADMELCQALLRPMRDVVLPWSCDETNGETSFAQSGILAAIRETREAHLAAIKHYKVGDKGIGYRLSNGSLMPFVYDFCVFLADERRASDCAALWLEKNGLGVCEAFVSFTNNGDRLAAALQRLVAVPDLAIFDPKEQERWKTTPCGRECVLVVDVLYAGDDEQGYVIKALRVLKERHVRVRQICVFADLRAVRGDIGGIPVGTAVTSAELEPPQPITRLSPNRNVRESLGEYGLPRPNARPEAAAGSESIGHVYRYSTVELSREFWQNVTDLGIIDSLPSGRDPRTVLFYEDNERFLLSSRMRKMVRDFVATFVKHTTRHKIDVVLHPTHAVGTFLAQTIADQLNRPPVILPVGRRTVVNSFEPSPGDYAFFQRELARTKPAKPRARLNALIVDDSALTGQSIMGLCGLAGRLNLHVGGVLVLLNRLTPEASTFFDQVSIPMRSLYRLHMPVLTEEESPDLQFEALNDSVRKRSQSYFAQRWSAKLHPDREGRLERFRAFLKGVDENVPFELDWTPKRLRVQNMQVHVLRQIIFNLILNPDRSAFRLETRLAVAYNFLAQLVYEPAFWMLLRLLLRSPHAVRENSAPARFVRAVLYVLAHSRHISPGPVFRQFERTCMRMGRQGLIHGNDGAHLVADALMNLAITRSFKFWALAEDAIRDVLPSAVDTVLYPELSSPIKTETALTRVGPFAWGVELAFAHGAMPLGSAAVQRLGTLNGQPVSTAHLFALEALHPALECSEELRAAAGVESRRHADSVIGNIAPGPDGDGETRAYLTKAPGFACTLKSVLECCEADTILLYVRQPGGPKWTLLTLQTRDDRVSLDDLTTTHFSQENLPVRWQHALEEGLPYLLTDESTVTFLDVFSTDPTHLWAFGAPIRSDDDERYYVILGYKQQNASPSQVATAFYYWLRCERWLREIVKSLQQRHRSSLANWIAVSQGLRPLHPLRLIRGAGERLVERRRVLRLASTYLDIGEMMRRSVKIVDPSLYKLSTMQVQLFTLRQRIETAIERACAEFDEPNVLATGEIVILEKLSPSLLADSRYCTMQVGALQFMFYEALFNALTYHDTYVNIKLQIDPLDTVDDITRIAVGFNMANDGAIPKKTRGRGVAACAAAAHALGGYFVAGPSEDQEGVWLTKARLPAFEVPPTLVRNLYATLKGL